MTDQLVNNNNNRSIVIAYRVLGLLKDEEILSPSLFTFFKNLQQRNTQCSEQENKNSETSETYDSNNIEAYEPFPSIYSEETDQNAALEHFCQDYFELHDITLKLRNKSTGPHETADLLFQKVLLFRPSPDALISKLDELESYVNEAQTNSEVFSCQVLKACIILEYLYNSKQVPSNFYYNQTPSILFENIIPICHEFSCPYLYQFDIPTIPSFIDSGSFNQFSLLTVLYKCIKSSYNTPIAEISSSLVDVVLPFLDHSRFYHQASGFLSIFSESIESCNFLNTDDSSYRYFRVTFYGKLLGNENGKSYIYQTKPFTQLFPFCESIKQYLQTLITNSDHSDNSNDPNDLTLKTNCNLVEVITESGAIDVSLLDENKVYFQMTKVQPYLNKHSLSACRFWFDIPFVPGEKKAQGSVETQWIRRTIVQTRYSFPYPVFRSQIMPELTMTKEYSPIKVSRKNLKSRILQLEASLKSNNMMELQQLLVGSLLVQVNEGPAKIAEVFLQNLNVNSKQIQRQQDKIKSEFQYFLRLLENSLKVHTLYTAQNPTHEALNIQLEDGLKNFKAYLEPLIC